MSESPIPIVETDGLTKVYQGQVAVDHVTFSVCEREIFGLLGPNGAGKTTILLMLLGLTEPTSGYVRVLGHDPTRDAIKVKRLTGYMPENMGFYSDLNALQTLRFIAQLNDIPRKVAEERIQLALATVGLEGEAEKKVGAYSRGMRQRLGLAEILVKQPQLAILDEPTVGLDPEATSKIIDLIATLSRQEGMTVILSSHYLEMIQRLCTRIGMMIKGRMVAVGTIEALATEKFGVGDEEYSLEDLYMKFFRES